jgi:hypothetical protein
MEANNNSMEQSEQAADNYDAEAWDDALAMHRQ